MSTRIQRPANCPCLSPECTRIRQRENRRAAAWSAVVVAGIYCPWYLLDWIMR